MSARDKSQTSNYNYLFPGLLCAMLFFGQHSLSMDNKALVPVNETFTYFSQLQPELQDYIFGWSGNKKNLQTVSVEKYKRWTSNAPEVYKIACHGLNNHYKDEVRIFLGAVYFKHYNTVENILKNSGRKSYGYYFDNVYHYEAITSHSIARNNDDGNMLELFNKYHFSKVPVKRSKNGIVPTCLMMYSYFGDVERIKTLISIDPQVLQDETSVHDSLSVIINHRNTECLNILLMHENVKKLIDIRWGRLNQIMQDDTMQNVLKVLLMRGCYSTIRLQYFLKAQSNIEIKPECRAIVEKYIADNSIIS